jgi:membrane-associated HD superfamily phosphohydrolase
MRNEKKTKNSKMEKSNRPQRLALAGMLVGIATLIIAFLLLTDRAEVPMAPIQTYTIVLLVLGALLVIATLVVGVLAIVATIRAKSPYLWMAVAGLVVGLVSSVFIILAAVVVWSKLI